MLKLIKLIAIASIFFLNTSIVAKPYTSSEDQCSDILRDGVRDELASSSSSTHNLAKHNQFCSIAKKHELNETNFEHFATEYAKKVETHDDSMGASASVGYGPFSFDGDYENSKKKSSLSEEEKKEFLKKNSMKILDYYTKNCGNSSYQESLQKEASAISKIANPNLIEAWKNCMVTKNGLFAFIKGDEEKNNFAIQIEWKTLENSAVQELRLKWSEKNIKIPYNTMEISGFSISENICEKDGLIYDNGNLIVPISRHSNDFDDLVYINAKTNSGFTKSISVFLPKKINIKPHRIERNHFSIEYHCANPKCPKYGKKAVEELVQRDEYIFSQHQLESYVCPVCSKKMAVQSVFNDCFYKIHGQAEHGGFSFLPWSLAHSLARTFTIHSGDEKSTPWQKLKIKVREKNFQPEKDEI